MRPRLNRKPLHETVKGKQMGDKFKREIDKLAEVFCEKCTICEIEPVDNAIKKARKLKLASSGSFYFAADCEFCKKVRAATAEESDEEPWINRIINGVQGDLRNIGAIPPELLGMTFAEQ